MSFVVKWISKPEALACELACSLAAQAFRLQVPGGALILAERQQLPGLPQSVRGAPADMVLCFGSELQYPDPTVARPTGRQTAEEWTWRRVCATPVAAMGGVWDELVANTDRNYGNVVFDGLKWWLIDHERTLGPVAKVMKKFAEQTSRQKVIDYRSPENRLAWEVMQRQRESHKMQAIPSSWTNLRNRLRWLAELTQRWQTRIPTVNNVLFMTHIYLHSIDLRLPALALHLEARLANPVRRSLWTSS